MVTFLDYFLMISIVTLSTICIIPYIPIRNEAFSSDRVLPHAEPENNWP